MKAKKKVYRKSARPAGTSIFVLGIIIATFIGGAFRTFFSTHQIEQFIGDQIKKNNPKFELKFESAELSLSKGLLPRIGLELVGVKIFAKDICDSPLSLDIDKVYVPLYIVKLLKNQLKFATIEFGQMQLEHRRESCERDLVATSRSNTEKIVSVKKDEPIDIAVEQFFNFVSTRWEKELANTKKWLDGVKIQKLTLSNLGNSSQIHFFENVYLNMNTEEKKPVQLSFVFTPDSYTVYHQPLQKIQFSSQIEEELIRWKGESAYKEGSLIFSGNFLMASGQFEAQSRLKNVPVASIFQGFAVRNILPDIEGSRPIWMNCQQIFKGKLDEWQNSEIDLEDCKISGELGSIEATKIKLFPFQKPVSASAFKLKLHHFSMKNLLDVFGKKPKIEWIHQMGLVSGHILVESLEKMHFKGQVSNPSFRFTLNGERKYQQASYIKGELLFSEGRFSGKLYEGEFQEGKFEGELTFNFDNKFREGVFQSNISQMEFQPEVMKLLQLTGVSHFEVYGQGKMVGGDLETWDGSFGFPKMETEDLEVSKAKFKANWKEHRWDGRFSIKNLKVTKRHPLFEILYPLYLEESEKKQEIEISNLVSQININEEAFIWKKGRAWDLKEKVIFASQGQFDAKGNLSGQISVDFPVLKLLQWNVEGTLEKPKLSPSPKMLRELAKKKPELPVPTVVELGTGQFYLPKAFQKNSLSGLKKIRDSVFNSAKKLLPGNRKENSVEEQEESKSQ